MDVSTSPFQLLWSQPLLTGPRGLALAREKGWLAAWDDQRWLYLLNAEGKRQGQVHLEESLTAAAIADDGSALAAGGKSGTVWWFDPDLSIRWQRPLGERILATALDPYGQFLAVANAKDQMVILDRPGEVVAQWNCPRPLHHLAFVPAAPCLLGSSDFGLVAGFDLTGKVLWRDGLVSRVGSLASSGDGSLIALSCYTDGIQRYRLDGGNLGKVKTAGGCRLLTLAFDARVIVTAGLDSEIALHDRNGASLGNQALESPAAGLAVAALGEEVYVAQQDGRVLGYRLILKTG